VLLTGKAGFFHRLAAIRIVWKSHWPEFQSMFVILLKQKYEERKELGKKLEKP
jgi:hypothetical protein